MPGGVAGNCYTTSCTTHALHALLICTLPCTTLSQSYFVCVQNYRLWYLVPTPYTPLPPYHMSGLAVMYPIHKWCIQSYVTTYTAHMVTIWYGSLHTTDQLTCCAGRHSELVCSSQIWSSYSIQLLLAQKGLKGLLPRSRTVRSSYFLLL